MAVRPAWKGYIKLSLVTCAVELYNATTSAEKVSFHILNRATGNTVRRQYVDPGTGKPVDEDDEVKGYEVSDDKYILIEEDEIEAVQIESSHTLSLDGFVEKSEIDPIYLDTPYYLAPADKVSQEAFAVIREALAQKKMAGLARIVLYRRERPVVIEPFEKGMLLTTLRFSRQVREPDEILGDIAKAEPDDEMMQLASHIVDRHKLKFDPKQFEDKYEEALLDLVKAKRRGKKPPAAKPDAEAVQCRQPVRRAEAEPRQGRRRNGRQDGPLQAKAKGHSTKASPGRPSPAAASRHRTMALEQYHAKRDFRVTAEPRGRKGRAAGKQAGGIFVVQKHDATRLHYDFRLEHDGVLWSWAVTRGPSLDPSEKRLAVHVEDHPLDYASFEGIIPEGQYGAGAVIVWDQGKWIPEGDPAAGMKKGHLRFALEGDKLKGAWHLVRLRPRSGEKRDNWLLIKSDDEHADRRNDILEDAPQSVKSGQTIDQVGNNPDARKWKSNRKAKSAADDRAEDRVTEDSQEECRQGRRRRGEAAAVHSALPGAARKERAARRRMAA